MFRFDKYTKCKATGSTITIGSHVRIVGLDIPALDGREGVCQQLDAGKCFVQLDGGEWEHEVPIMNLQLVDKAWSIDDETNMLLKYSMSMRGFMQVLRLPTGS